MPRDSKQGKLMGRDGYFSQCNRSLMDHWAELSCYTGFFNVRRGWQSLNMWPRFYLRLIRRMGWLWIYTSRTTDGRPFKPKKLSVPFIYPGVPAELTPFRGLGRRNLVPILPPESGTLSVTLSIWLPWDFNYYFEVLRSVICSCLMILFDSCWFIISGRTAVWNRK